MLCFYEFSTGARVVLRLAVDELFIYRLQEKIGKLTYYYKKIIYDKTHKEKDFVEKLSKWFTEQGWSFFIEDEDCYNRIAHQIYIKNCKGSNFLSRFTQGKECATTPLPLIANVHSVMDISLFRFLYFPLQ